jgi:hypothetical protein
MPLSTGIAAPDFSLFDETGVEHKLVDYRGRPVVLYFYPKDDTPGCTTAPIHPRAMPNSRRNMIYLLRCWQMKTIRCVSCIRYGAARSLWAGNMMVYFGPPS